LALQKLTMTNQAKESWENYLQKDSTSKWADEVRKNLERIAQFQSRFKKKEQILQDFSDAYRSGNFDLAKMIHNQTKGMHNTASLPRQLARSYLEARLENNEQKIKETISALRFIGNYEEENHADFFVSEIANYYTNIGDKKVNKLLQAHDLFENSLDSLYSSDITKKRKYADTIKLFEKSRDEFNHDGDIFANISELWAASLLQDVSKSTEGINRLTSLIKVAEAGNYKTIQADAVYWLGITLYSQTKYSEIKRKIDTALKIAEQTQNYFEIEHCSEYLGNMFLDLGELDKSQEYASRILQTGEIYYQSESNFWRNQLFFSDFAKRMQYYSTALDFGKESLFVARKILPDLSAVNSSLIEISNALVKKKQFDEALKYANESNKITLEKEDSAENSKAVAETFMTIADIKSEMNNCSEALGDYEKSFAYLKNLPEQPIGYLYQLHRGKLFCFNSLGMQNEFQAELEDVLKISETYRTNIREDESRQTFFDNEQVVFDLATDNSITQIESKKAFEYVEISKARSLLDFVKSKKTISEVEKDFGNIAKPLTLNEIQSRLPADLQVFEYAVLPKKLVVWKITKTTFEVSESLISNEELDKKISDYHASLQDKVSSNLLKNQAKELYNILFPKGFEKGNPICIVPDKSLHRLSFVSLISNENRYLIEDSAVFLSPSGSILVLETENAKAKESVKNETVLSVGNPKFDSVENPFLQDLPQAEIEVNEIAKNYSDSKTFLNEDALKSAFLNNMSKFNVIHFAGHYVANSESPNNSKLLFSDDDLRSAELAEKKLPRSKLVVLSACDTGVERFNRSEGAIGIARTFLAMGTPVVLASSWKVDSEAAKNLMISFHKKRRAESISSIEALRQSQLEMLKTSEFSSPYYWSAFTITGGFANY
jgi:CHAT domain-containing protein